MGVGRRGPVASPAARLLLGAVLLAAALLLPARPAWAECTARFEVVTSANDTNLAFSGYR